MVSQTSQAVQLDSRAPAGPSAHAFSLPDIPELRRVPQRIADDDESELRWYLRNPAVASVTHSSGAFGNQLEIASAYGYGSLPCRRCGGRWRTRRRGGKETVVDWRDGTGFCPRDHFGKRITYAAALAAYRQKMQREHGIVLSSMPNPRPDSNFTAVELWEASKNAFSAQGKRLMTDAQFRSLFDRLPEEATQTCRVCGGIGVIPRRAAAHVEITAYPTGSSKSGSNGKVKDAEWAVNNVKKGVLRDGLGTVHMGELERYREMHSTFTDVAKLSELAVISLEEYYVDQNGQRALEDLLGARFGLVGSAKMRSASQLRDFQCACFNLAAYGVS